MSEAARCWLGKIRIHMFKKISVSSLLFLEQVYISSPEGPASLINLIKAEPQR